MSFLGQLWALGRKIDELLTLQTKTSKALGDIDARLRAVEDRVTRFEARHDQVIVEARAAATTAFSAAAGAMFADIVTRLTRVEESFKHLPPQPRDS